MLALPVEAQKQKKIVKVVLHGQDKTSGFATPKQKEEGANSYQCHYNNSVQPSCYVACIVLGCYIQALVSEDTSDILTDSKKYDLPGYAVLNTSKGYITVELYKDGSPEIVDKFLDSCQKGYFKGMPFHHVIKHYVIQGGHSQGLGATEDWTTKVKLRSRLATSPKHEAFMLGTLKTKDSQGFEIFITTAPIPDLSDKLMVFGRVIKGEDVVQAGKQPQVLFEDCKLVQPSTANTGTSGPNLVRYVSNLSPCKLVDD
ncbi:hypothetical protein GH714_039817 [Hevea brasiliensis]|uniref:Peptidyl-prolyl cis-trans isomerase n=1 Tax=Hevea brasiliensis TaxID=3981 RepID=A0A6A6MGC0_HEVBR|nr:hypothetical protein GH714_039817 [Hevea brasiliensis]